MPTGQLRECVQLAGRNWPYCRFGPTRRGGDLYSKHLPCGDWHPAIFPAALAPGPAWVGEGQGPLLWKQRSGCSCLLPYSSHR